VRVAASLYLGTCTKHQPRVTFGQAGLWWVLFYLCIHKVGGTPVRPVGSHMATVDRARDQWLQIVWKQRFLVF